MSQITVSEVEYVAALARLELGEDEKLRMTRQLDHILGYIVKLNELDTSNVEPTSHVLPIRNVMRPDTMTASLTRDEALNIAPASYDGYYEVARVIE